MNLYIIFIDHEKGHASISRVRVLGWKNVPRYYVHIIKGMYESAKTNVHLVDGISRKFSVTIGLRQALASSSYFFYFGYE